VRGWTRPRLGVRLRWRGVRAAVRRHWLRPALFSLLIAATFAGVLQPLDDFLLDQRFRVIDRAPSGSLVVVEIDPRSIAKYERWPWSRSAYAEAVRELEAAGARVIGFDVDFSSLSDREGDLAFRDALAARPGQVVLPVLFQSFSPTAANAALRQRGPHPLFLRDVAVASINLIVEPNGLVRRGWYGSMTMNGYRPSLASA